MHNSVEGSKRHLPPWMVPKAGANNVINSDIVVETNCSEVKGDIITEKAGNGTKKNARVDQKRETLKRKSKLDAKCEVKKRRRNLSEHDGSDDNVVQKKKKKKEKKKKSGARSRDRVTKSSRKKHQNFEDPSHDSCVVNPVQASSDADDDLELTVEDLMTIAKQYVNDYEDKKRQETSVRQCQSNWQFTAEGESGTTLDSHCGNSKQSSYSRETPCDSATTTSESITTSTFQTVHIAQEMLDLFLGPLLKKTIEIEKEQEKNKSVADSSEVTNQFTRQSKDNHVGEEKMVPMMKKRSTLKDKVAMFLD